LQAVFERLDFVHLQSRVVAAGIGHADVYLARSRHP
jgi:hypothetical protein